MAPPRATRVNMSGTMKVVSTSCAAGDIGPGWPKNAVIFPCSCKVASFGSVPRPGMGFAYWPTRNGML